MQANFINKMAQNGEEELEFFYFEDDFQEEVEIGKYKTEFKALLHIKSNLKENNLCNPRFRCRKYSVR